MGQKHPNPGLFFNCEICGFLNPCTQPHSIIAIINIKTISWNKKLHLLVKLVVFLKIFCTELIIQCTSTSKKYGIAGVEPLFSLQKIYFLLIDIKVPVNNSC